MIYAQWKELGQPMPFALTIGTAPAIPFVSAMPLADGVNEADFIGAYLGEPLEVVDCETVDLQLPATSEIVLEGMVSIEETDDVPDDQLPGRISFRHGVPPDVQEKVLRDWQHYGYRDG
jgi:UbiD family decarboxylase